MPRDFGQARMAALAWLMGFAQKKNHGDAFLTEHRPARGSSSPHAAWDWYYLQLLRQDTREICAAARELARSSDPAGQWAYLHALSGRTGTDRSGRSSRPGAVDTTPPLPADELDRVVAGFQTLRKEKPQWLTTDVLTNVLTELKRAKRTKEEEQVYRDAVATASAGGQPGLLRQVLFVAAKRGDLDTVLGFFDRLNKLQGSAPAP